MTHTAVKNMPGWLARSTTPEVLPAGQPSFLQAVESRIIPGAVSYLRRTDVLKFNGTAFCERVIDIDPLSCLPSGTSGSGTDPNPSLGGSRSLQPGGFNDWWKPDHATSSVVNGTNWYAAGLDSGGNFWEHISDLSVEYKPGWSILWPEIWR
jgi:hypothetical protein